MFMVSLGHFIIEDDIVFAKSSADLVVFQVKIEMHCGTEFITTSAS